MTSDAWTRPAATASLTCLSYQRRLRLICSVREDLDTGGNPVAKNSLRLAFPKGSSGSGISVAV